MSFCSSPFSRYWRFLSGVQPVLESPVDQFCVRHLMRQNCPHPGHREASQQIVTAPQGDFAHAALHSFEPHPGTVPELQNGFLWESQVQPLAKLIKHFIQGRSVLLTEGYLVLDALLQPQTLE